MIPCLTFLFWVWFESRFLWIIFDLITFWSSFASGSGLARRSGDSARPGRVPASPCSPPERCHLKEKWMTWFTNFRFKWVWSEDLFLSTQTPDKLKRWLGHVGVMWIWVRVGQATKIYQYEAVQISCNYNIWRNEGVGAPNTENPSSQSVMSSSVMWIECPCKSCVAFRGTTWLLD